MHDVKDIRQLRGAAVRSGNRQIIERNCVNGYKKYIIYIDTFLKIDHLSGLVYGILDAEEQ